MKPWYWIIIAIVVIVLLYILLKPKAVATPPAPGTPKAATEASTFSLAGLLASIFGTHTTTPAPSTGTGGPLADGAFCQLYNSDGTPLSGAWNASTQTCDPIGFAYRSY